MSKQRPSSWRRITPGGAVRSSSRRNSVALWRRRVFQNSYTRNGRTRRVSRWSVKIQHRGRRHTLSLTAASRVAAAREARSLNDIIRREGWDAARQILGRGSPASSPPAPATSRGGGWSKSDARYLRERLIHSKYTEARLTKTKEFSVRLEHEGIDHYFPLGTDDREHATAQAIKIYHTIVTQGWNAACHQFPREITVAIFWSTSPVACTYATLFTFAGEFVPNPLPAPATAGPRKRVFVIESDTEVRRTLAFWLGRQPGFDCTRVFQNAEEARVIIVRDPPDLLLVNRALPGMPVAEFLEQLKIRLPNVPAFMYGIYQDSDHIFITLSGVTAGYIFRRRKPTELFEPIQGALRQRVLEFAKDGRFELYKTSAKFDGAPGRKQHGFPPEETLKA